METENLKEFERLSEGVILFNEDGTFDYANKVACNLLLADEKNKYLYKTIVGLVNKIICESRNDPIMVTLINVQSGRKVKCSISTVNGYFLVVLGKNIDDRPRGFGVPSPVGLIRDLLGLMTTVYVGGRLNMANYSHI